MGCERVFLFQKLGMRSAMLQYYGEPCGLLYKLLPSMGWFYMGGRFLGDIAMLGAV